MKLLFFRCHGRLPVVKKLMETDFGLFLSRLLPVQKLQKCILFNDQSPMGRRR
jgi:hypothetical protein